MLLKWLPWKYMVRRVARHHGFLDPLLILSRLGSFAQPSEVGEPIELLRAGLVFHARGLMNTRAIQNNLDWIWPYWVERQFNPRDASFIPRAFSISHVNLSHRNWTAVGLPNTPFLPLVDPAGLVTPYFDGWSLDAWIVRQGAPSESQAPDLLPSKSRGGPESKASLSQALRLEPDSLAIETTLRNFGYSLDMRVEALPEGHSATCRLRIEARSDTPAWLALSLRPYNPEGVSFLHEIGLDSDRRSWKVDGRPAVILSEAAERHFASSYHEGDVYRMLSDPAAKEKDAVRCKVGLATAAALYAIPAGGHRTLEARIDLSQDKESRAQVPSWRAPIPWADALSGTARLDIPETQWTFLYDAAVRSLLIHSPGEVYPGPYTYKRFWFRDAAFILDALIAVGLADRAEATLDLFPEKQTLGGYFLSQEGEWDSNGEALWILARWCRATGRKPKPAWIHSILKGGDWIPRKRLRKPPAHADHLVDGLLPAGFSAEHLGPNDYYYWDDFWGVAGLEAAADLLERSGLSERAEDARRFRREAADFRAAIDTSIAGAQKARMTGSAVPASPYRRMDSGAVGNLCAAYPLVLWSPEDPRMAATVEFLLGRCLIKGGFFQDMIHSGINAYLTMHMAQALLRSGDMRCLTLIRDTATLASPTGQWPEAIHPHTLGGCMGDGQHVWAAAEWVILMRNLFLREEGRGLILASGVAPEWIASGRPSSFGPGPTAFGPVTVRVTPVDSGTQVSWQARWHEVPERLEIRVPGHGAIQLPPDAEGSVVARRL